MTGRSVPLDPRSNAVRADLADIRLAGRVFAPHYAAPMPRHLACAADLLEAPGGAPLASLAAGSPFEVLEITGGHAWGRAPGPELVGYLDRAVLEPA